MKAWLLYQEFYDERARVWSPCVNSAYRAGIYVNSLLSDESISRAEYQNAGIFSTSLCGYDEVKDY